MNGLVLAARYLTIVPLPGRAPRDLTTLGSAALWFPVIGVALGAVLVAVDLVLSRLFPALLSAVLTVAVWKLLTGGLHLDGLADCLDGLLGRDAEHRLAIMRDSRIGAFGVVGLLFVLMLDIVALSQVPEGLRQRLLLTAPAVARATPACLARLFALARDAGQGAAFASTMPRWVWGPGLALAALVAGVALGVVGLVGALAAVGAAVALARFLAGRLGGITGDVLGAAVETAELALVLTVAAWIHGRR